MRRFVPAVIDDRQPSSSRGLRVRIPLKRGKSRSAVQISRTPRSRQMAMTQASCTMGPIFTFSTSAFSTACWRIFWVSADRVGGLLDHLVCNHVLNEDSACDREVRISSHRTEHGAEVDLIAEIGRELWAVEVKSSRSVTTADLPGMQSLGEYRGNNHRSCPGSYSNVAITGAWSEGFSPLRSSRSISTLTQRRANGALTRMWSMRMPQPRWNAPAR